MKKSHQLNQANVSLLKWIISSVILVSLIAIVSRIGNSAWRALAVPAMEPRFLDLYTITEGNRCVTEMNLNPLISNPCDPYSRVMNYPKIWLRIAELLGNSPTLLAYLILSIGFLGFLVYSYRLDKPNIRIFYYGISVLSPVTLLGIERGNTDIAVLGICAVGIKLVTSSKDLYKAIGIFLIFLASILKLFPIVCLITVLVLVMLQTSTKKLKCLAIALPLLFSLIMLLTWTDFLAILKGTPSPSTYAFGLGQSLSLINSLGRGIIPIIFLCTVLAVLLLQINHAFDKKKRITSSRKKLRFVIPGGVFEQQLLLSSSLFASTLMLSSWAYRYIFAFLLIPPLLDLRNQLSNELRHRLIDKVILIIMIIPVLLALQYDSGLSVSKQFVAVMSTPLCIVVIGVCLNITLLRRVETN